MRCGPRSYRLHDTHHKHTDPVRCERDSTTDGRAATCAARSGVLDLDTDCPTSSFSPLSRPRGDASGVTQFLPEPDVAAPDPLPLGAKGDKFRGGKPACRLGELPRGASMSDG